jgi:hypothetical protein
MQKTTHILVNILINMPKGSLYIQAIKIIQITIYFYSRNMNLIKRHIYLYKNKAKRIPLHFNGYKTYS